MHYFVWSLPAIALIAAVGSGRTQMLTASLIGVGVALVVALSAAPAGFCLTEAGLALARGGWIGWVVVPYIAGGLLFWRMAARPDGGAAAPAPLSDPKARRRLLFAACFLIGPFAEAATGFGVGIVGAMLLIRRLELRLAATLTFSLLSQTMVLWGAMGSGAIFAAAFAQTDATELALNASPYMAVLNVLWLPLFWRLAKREGVDADWRKCASEAIWLGSAVVLVIAATAFLGPETAMLAAYGPLIVLRYLADERPTRAALLKAARGAAPFAVLIGWLAATRLIQPLENVLMQTGRMQPFAGTLEWAPLFHAGTWFIIAAILTGVLRGHLRALPSELRETWRTGRTAILTMVTFSMMAEVLSASGVAAGLAQGVIGLFGRWSIMITPMISALFGTLTNSASAANGLFMSSQVSLATSAGLNVAAVIALQHMAALAMTMVSPVRIAIACSLAGTPGREREVYRPIAPFAAAVIGVLLAGSLLIALRVV